MKWSWKLGRFAGIDVNVHVTFLLIIGWMGISYWMQGHSVAAVVEGLLFILLLFLFVVLHEYGHALTARKFGIKTRDITLYPIGGAARLERMPDVPIQELWVALAGPAVNVFIGILLFSILFVNKAAVPISNLTIASGPFLQRLLLVNVWLVLFNLIPAFPMDGGRVLRSLLALRIEYTRATQVAATIGQGIAILFGFIGLFTNPFLLFIAFFVWIGAAQETSMVQIKHSLGGIPVSRAMLTDFESLSPLDTLDRVVQLILAGSQHEFPVVENGQVLGILTREDLIAALSRTGQDAHVKQVMRRDLSSVDSHDMVETALMRLQESGLKILPVIHNARLVGLITSENITEFLMIRSALKLTG